ncbi:MAG: polysaccharide export protein [Syntrophales bacterium]|nr:polysaccharide export protein [Syntrophales bacterium]MDD5641702.1 polysaccharide export protein [Syntrophales bacterium]
MFDKLNTSHCLSANILNRKGLKIATLVLLICLTGIIPAFSQQDYVLGPEDMVEIKVWDHEDLTRKQRVGLEGKISFPFVGDIKAQGLTVLQLQKELEHCLGQGYIVDPHVSVTITDYKSKKFFVVGKVKNPGTYPLTKNIKVVEAISLAGGLSQASGKSASGGTAIIVRARPGEKSDQPRLPDQVKPQERINILLNAAMSGDPRNNVEIKNGDTIYVPALFLYITGEVKRPGRYPYEEGMTVLQAVTTAGGFSDKAAPGRTSILREQGGVKKKIGAKLDDPIRPEDTIVVPESWF